MAFLTVAITWSGLHPFDRLTWSLEVFWVAGAIVGWIGWWRKLPCTSILFVLLAVHATLLIVGGHYTYERVPIGEWVQGWLGRPRNDFDRLGHFLQGFVPALLARELFIRCHVIARRGWRTVAILAFCLAFSAAFELLEFGAARMYGAAADHYLAMQGDVWDTQWDMILCLSGAIAALVLLAPEQDREMNEAQTG